jgi:hypothetical protein
MKTANALYLSPVSHTIRVGENVIYCKFLIAGFNVLHAICCMLRDIFSSIEALCMQCVLLDNGLELQDQQENQSSSKIRREGRTIPNLIYYIEDYERYLIQLSRITKVNLMRHAKRSTARDFKIMDTVKKARAVAHRTTGAAHPAVEPEEEAGDEAVEEAEGEGEEGDEEIREQAEEGEEEELVNQEGVDDEETEENVAEGLEAVEVGAGGEDQQEDDDVVAESDEEAVQAVVSSHVSEDRRSKGSAPRRRNRVVDSNDESDGEQPVSCQDSAKRQRSL